MPPAFDENCGTWLLDGLLVSYRMPMMRHARCAFGLIALRRSSNRSAALYTIYFRRPLRVLPNVEKLSMRHPATPVSVDFHFRDTDAAKVLKPKKLLGAAYFRGTAFTLGVVDVNPIETQ